MRPAPRATIGRRRLRREPIRAICRRAMATHRDLMAQNRLPARPRAAAMSPQSPASCPEPCAALPSGTPRTRSRVARLPEAVSRGLAERMQNIGEGHELRNARTLTLADAGRGAPGRSVRLFGLPRKRGVALGYRYFSWDRCSIASLGS